MPVLRRDVIVTPGEWQTVNHDLLTEELFVQVSNNLGYFILPEILIDNIDFVYIKFSASYRDPDPVKVLLGYLKNE